jgi:hypothetical protein
MRRLWEAFGVADALVTLWWLAQGAPQPSLAALAAPAPGWLQLLAGLLVAAVAAVTAAGAVAVTRAVLAPPYQ